MRTHYGCLLAALITTCSAFSPGSPGTGRNAARLASAKIGQNAVNVAQIEEECRLLDADQFLVPFGDEGSWWACDTPGQPMDDPMLVCFQAPDWMGLAEGAYVCSDGLQSSRYKTKNYHEDSY